MTICPRCKEQQIPNDAEAGRYPGALSRTDNETEICSECGMAEAFEAMDANLTPQTQWPQSGMNYSPQMKAMSALFRSLDRTLHPSANDEK